MFKDKKIATFYSNDFESLQVKEQVMDLDLHPGLADTFGGLATLFRWLGDEKMMRTRFSVPALIVAYNMFMNAVDVE